MKKVIDLILYGFNWLKQRLAVRPQVRATEAPAHHTREQHGQLFGSLVSHDRRMSGRLF
ncbi:MAG TPA: hypothetical protein VGO35_01650 [Gammaproteobacteria bacterium]|jgi:hypothetical protein|nr:hypothetical protein [Gammaproteobacteria bacterium]